MNQAYVTCLLFKGTSKVHVLSRKDFADGVVADIEDSLRFIERNTRTAYRIEKLQREELPQYPVAALREAITNAVMHRYWFIDGANVFVEIYEDRIEVSSPGGLPGGMLPEDLGSKSVRRNPRLLQICCTVLLSLKRPALVFDGCAKAPENRDTPNLSFPRMFFLPLCSGRFRR